MKRLKYSLDSLFGFEDAGDKKITPQQRCNNMKKVLPQSNIETSEKAASSKEYEEGECETSSDEDIIAIDENGKKLEEAPITQTTRSQTKNKEIRG